LIRARVIVVGALLGACGCDEKVCMDRGTAHHYDGPTTYDAPVGKGTARASVTVDDFDPFAKPQPGWSTFSLECEEHGMRFTVHVDDCTLWASESGETVAGGGTRYDPSYLSSAEATIDAEPSCVLPVDGGHATVAIKGGTLAMTETGLELTLDGSIATWPLVEQPSGHVTYTFRSP
jgi:hypothetical protein